MFWPFWPNPVLYRHDRVGCNRRLFIMLIFRTVVSDAERHGSIAVFREDADLPGGRWFCGLEVDEPPTPLNLLKGGMSTAGPRPDAPEYVQLCTQEQGRLLSGRPGMAPLQFRIEAELLREANDLERAYLEQVMLDKNRLNPDYVNRKSFLSDLRIIKGYFFLLFAKADDNLDFAIRRDVHGTHIMVGGSADGT